MARDNIRRRVICAAVAATIAFAVEATGVTALGRPSEVAPAAMAAVGDSLSSGFPGPAANSWSTGTTLNSHAARLKALKPSLVTHNFAQPGQTVSAFASQAASVVAAGGVGYVTVMFGGNDICNPLGGVATGETLFRQRFRAGLEALRDGLPGVKILVVSLSNPETQRLAMIAGRRSGEAQYCSRFFAKAKSKASKDVKRRARIVNEVKLYNRIMVEECALIVGCKTDGGAMFKHKWKSNEIGPDGSHLTKRGNETVARITWNAGFSWTSS